MKQIVDCRGMVCPEPVIKTKDALESIEEGIIEVVVDNDASKSNVERFAASQGCNVAVHSADNTHTLTISKGEGATASPGAKPAEQYTCDLPDGGLIYVIPADTMGRGDDNLGSVLMRAFIKSIMHMAPQPSKIFFYNSGVTITATESDLIAPLQELEKQGVEIYSCGTCLDFFNLTDNLLVGSPTNMYEIMDAMTQAKKVVSPY